MVDHDTLLFYFSMSSIAILVICLAILTVKYALAINHETLPLDKKDIDQFTSCDDSICIKNLTIAGLDETLYIHNITSLLEKK